MKQDNYALDLLKIKTNVSGFDDLLYGGLRLPELRDGSGRDGICIVIYGNRGIGKTDLAMQIMRGVDEYLNKYSPNNKKITPKFKTLNHRESELRKKYIGLEVANMLGAILSPESVENNTKCNICKFFPKLKEKIEGIECKDIHNGEDCTNDKMNDCIICKLIKHEVINYSDNTQSLHWTFGDVSDYRNYVDTLDSSIISTSDIFEKYNEEGNVYTSVAYKRFKKYQKEIYDEVEKRNNISKDNYVKTNDFTWSSYVIEGFTAFEAEELKRLPFTDLILNMRKTSAVSILVFDEKGKDLNLNADIIIQMQQITDEKSQYTYYQLQIIKSDLQQHVHGWHKYRKLRDLSVKIYPSMHSHLAKRFSSDNAVIKLEQRNLRYPQSLLDYFQVQCANNINNNSVDYTKTLRDIFNDKGHRDIVYNEDNIHFRVSLIEQDNYDDFIYKVANSSKSEENTISFFLLGKTEQFIRRKLSIYSDLEKEDRRRIHYWESGLGCWAEEFASILKDYISRWKRTPNVKDLHIIIDDFANINLFPLMNKEILLVPALVNICKKAITQKGFDDNKNNINIQLSLVCTSQNEAYKVIRQLVENQ